MFFIPDFIKETVNLLKKAMKYNDGEEALEHITTLEVYVQVCAGSFHPIPDGERILETLSKISHQAYGLVISDRKAKVKKALSSGNYLKAEEHVTVLESYGEEGKIEILELPQLKEATYKLGLKKEKERAKTAKQRIQRYKQVLNGLTSTG